MAEEQRLLREAAQVLLTLLRCISMKRALNVTDGDRLNFFRLYDGCLMDVAVLSWCKLFGSEKEKLHWTRLFPATTPAVRKQIEPALGVAAGGQLNSLSNEMRNYRDTYVAHHDLDGAKRAKSHPELDPLKATGQALYSIVYSTLADAGFANGLPPPCKILGDNLQFIEDKWRGIAQAARDATKAHQEP